MVKTTVGAQNVRLSLGFVGLHGSSYPINYLYLWDGGTEEGVLQIQLADGATKHIEDLKNKLRQQFAAQIPDVNFSFEPADLISRVISMGVSTPIEVAVSGPNIAADRAFADKVKSKLETIPTLDDVQYSQSLDYPTVKVSVDRERAGIIGPTMAQGFTRIGRRQHGPAGLRFPTTGPTRKQELRIKSKLRFRKGSRPRLRMSATYPYGNRNEIHSLAQSWPHPPRHRDEPI